MAGVLSLRPPGHPVQHLHRPAGPGGLALAEMVPPTMNRREDQSRRLKSTVEPAAGEAGGLSGEAEFEVLRKADSSRNTTGQSGGDCFLTLMLRVKPGQELAGGVSCARASEIGVGCCRWDTSSNDELAGSPILAGGLLLQKPHCSTYEHPGVSWLMGRSLRNGWGGPIVRVPFGTIGPSRGRAPARRGLSPSDGPRQGKSAFRSGNLG
jgi:hypothetical protein